MSEVDKKYVVAVSGGVDSVSLLNMLANKELADFENCEIIVAHFDHGIRKDSKDDRVFVEELARQHGLKFVYSEGKLGANCSEAKAREMRYNFLRQCCKNNNASGIITAHHQDDQIETAVINLLRGTSWRGLAAMMQITNDNFQIANNTQLSNFKYQKSTTNQHPVSNVLILRPLLSKTKKEIINYANKNKLIWHEDSTNLDNLYLRNYVRNVLIPKAVQVDQNFTKKLLRRIEVCIKQRQEIESELSSIISKYQISENNYLIPRYNLIMWPTKVANEMVYSVLTNLDPNWNPSSSQIKRVVHFAKTAQIGKMFEVSKSLRIVADKLELSFRRTD